MELIIPHSKYSNTGFSYKGAKESRFRDYGATPSALKTEEQVLNASDRKKIVSRLYDLYRNNEFCAAIVDSYVSAIGQVQFRATENILVEDYLYDYFETLEYSGENLASVLRQVIIQLLLAGEVFVNKMPNGKIQLLEAAQIYSDKETENEVQGIIRNDKLEVIGYRLNGKTELKAKNIIHIFRRDRPSQIRGAPWLASALPALTDIAELVEAKLAQVKNSTMLVGVRKSPDPWEDGKAPTAQQSIKSGTILEIENDESFDLIQSETKADDFNQFLKHRIRQALATIGLPYENVFSYEDSSYSSSKATRGIFNNKVKELRRFFETKLLNPLYIWRSDKALIEDKLPKVQTYSWQFTALSALDPERDTKTNVLALQNKLTTRARIFAETYGSYWEEELEALYQEAAFEKNLQERYDVVIKDGEPVRLLEGANINEE